MNVFPSGNAEKLNCNEREKEEGVASLLFSRRIRVPLLLPVLLHCLRSFLVAGTLLLSTSSPSLDPFRERRVQEKTRLVTLAPLHPSLRRLFSSSSSSSFALPLHASQKLSPPFSLFGERNDSVLRVTFTPTFAVL